MEIKNEIEIVFKYVGRDSKRILTENDEKIINWQVYQFMELIKEDIYIKFNNYQLLSLAIYIAKNDHLITDLDDFELQILITYITENNNLTKNDIYDMAYTLKNIKVK